MSDEERIKYLEEEIKKWPIWKQECGPYNISYNDLIKNASEFKE